MHELVYLPQRFMPTAELSFIAVRKEMQRMLQLVLKMNDKLMYAFKTGNDKHFRQFIGTICRYEQTTDILEHKINTYLTRLTHGNLSRQAVAQSVTLFDVLTNIEHMADAAEKIARITDKFHVKDSFTVQDKEDFLQIAKLTKHILQRTSIVLIDFHPTEPAKIIFEAALRDERKLNTLRKTLLRQRRERILSLPPDPDTVTAYADILSNFELTGDYAIRSIEHLLLTRTENALTMSR